MTQKKKINAFICILQNRNDPGDLTREKFERLGNAEAVQRTFRQELPFKELSKYIFMQQIVTIEY